MCTQRSVAPQEGRSATAQSFPVNRFSVDFSNTCKATAHHVRELAGGTGAAVTLLHVAPPACSACHGAAEDHSRIDGYEGLHGLLSALAAFRDEYFNGVKCDSGSSSAL
jgi:hypothetical protein